MDKEIGIKPSREEVLKAAHEFECLDEQHYGSLWADRLERFAAAMYAKGAEDMRERAKKACDLAEDTGDDSGIERDVFIWNKATRYCMNKVAALPITPTNTEGEQE